MTTKVLLNTTRVGTIVRRAGDEFDETADAALIADVVSCGGVLVTLTPSLQKAVQIILGAQAHGDDASLSLLLTATQAAGEDWSTQASWYIDPSTGNDSNDGLTASTALKTGAELDRRLGRFKGAISGRVDIYIQGDTDLRLEVLRDVGSLVYLHGKRTTISSGTVTAYSAPVRTYGAAAKGKITCTGVTYTANTRARITSGPRAGAVAWIDADLGGGQASCSTWLLPNADPTVVTPTVVTPQNGDTIELYTVPMVTKGPIITQMSSVSATVVGVLIEDLTIGKSSATASRVFVETKSPVEILSFRFCDLSRATCMGPNMASIGCNISSSMYLRDGSMDYVGGLISGTLKMWGGNSSFFPDMDCLVTGTIGFDSFVTERGSFISCGTVGIFKASGSGVVMQPGTILRSKTNWDSTHQIYGACAGAGTFGIDVVADSAVLYDTNPPAISGGAGGADFRIVGKTSMRTLDEAAGTYTSAIALSWANLVAAKPSGFGHHAFDPSTGASVQRVAT